MNLNDTDKEKAAQAEIKMRDAYIHLAIAHSYLAASYMPESKTRPTNEECSDLFNRECDEAEKLMKEAFNANSVKVARYVDDPEPYKRALGAILECVTDNYLEPSFIAICKLHKIDPDDAHRSYRHWLDGAE